VAAALESVEYALEIMAARSLYGDGGPAGGAGAGAGDGVDVEAIAGGQPAGCGSSGVRVIDAITTGHSTAMPSRFSFLFDWPRFHALPRFRSL
jgi:hypothetical protein